MKNDSYWMSLALQEAEKAKIDNEVPVGAVIVKSEKILTSGYNKTISSVDPTAHAEVLAIRNASKVIKNHRITDATLYVTLEPCLMCYGAIIQSRISRVVFGAYDKNTGVCGTCFDIEKFNCSNHKPAITGGVLETECSKILTDFFKAKRI